MDNIEAVFARIIDNSLGRSTHVSQDLASWRHHFGGANQGILNAVARALDKAKFTVKVNDKETTIFSAKTPKTSFYLRVLKSRPEVRFNISAHDSRLRSVLVHHRPYKVERNYSCFSVRGAESASAFIALMSAAEGDFSGRQELGVVR